ncbi:MULTISPECIES: hypothetical protein [Halolamina]|uniref:Uncharacterized protein n=1 Tax=Halolamina pelagica TaxID=699431 RepID=A0A1I5RJQ1_9EURY|nr:MULTISPECIES: hypothetical protein [Halolamina]NHX35224.1 hypothetical protein [Halolamina sp. R1-12]SFP58794.1 hypothetical protein SAMN05216277_10514 [Halolamina pelagica]
MERSHVVIAVLVVVVALAGVAGALITGFGPAPGGGSADTSTPYEDTVVVESTDSGGSGGEDGDGSTSTATESQPPFSFVIESITECGQTCRDVNATIVNQQDTAATGVEVRSEIYTGGDLIWEGTSDVGTLSAGESFTDTKRVELSYSQAYKVQQNDGEILVKTYVRTDGGTYVFKDRRNVS